MTPQRSIEVSVQAEPRDGASWRSLARRCEQLGVRALLAPDHPGSAASPFVALAAAAAVTEHLRLGTYVVNTGVRRPLDIAADAATLDVVSNGRLDLGLGAGHTATEWRAAGRDRPDGPARARHLVESAAAVQALLSGGTLPEGAFGALDAVRLSEPSPVQAPVPLLIATTSLSALRWAGAHAQAVGLNGLGATRADGHRHAVNWDHDHLQRQLDAVHAGADGLDRDPPELEALVQLVRITDDAERAVDEIAALLAASPRLVRETPYVLVGTEDEIVGEMRRARARWGITRWVVREDALEPLEPLAPLLRRLADA